MHSHKWIIGDTYKDETETTPSSLSVWGIGGIATILYGPCVQINSFELLLLLNCMRIRYTYYIYVGMLDNGYSPYQYNRYLIYLHNIYVYELPIRLYKI